MRRLPVLVRRRNKWRTSSRLWGSPGTKQQCLGQTWFRWKGFEVTLNAGHAVKLKDFFGGHPERFGSHYGVDMFWRKMESKSLDWVVRTMLCGNQELSSKWTSLIVEDQALFTSRQQYHRNRMSHGKAHLVQAWVQETNWSWWTNCHQNQPAWDWRIRFGSGTKDSLVNFYQQTGSSHIKSWCTEMGIPPMRSRTWPISSAMSTPGGPAPSPTLPTTPTWSPAEPGLLWSPSKASHILLCLVGWS